MPQGQYLRPEPIKRFLEKVYICKSGCWLWLGGIKDNGYSSFSYPGGNYAHRFSHEFFVGKIPSDLEIDHLCRVRCCVNPDHLEVVTASENQRRGDNAIKGGRCKKGAHYNNFYLRPDGHRQCRGCKGDNQARWLTRNPTYGRDYMRVYNKKQGLEKKLASNLQLPVLLLKRDHGRCYGVHGDRQVRVPACQRRLRGALHAGQPTRVGPQHLPASP